QLSPFCVVQHHSSQSGGAKRPHTEHVQGRTGRNQLQPCLQKFRVVLHTPFGTYGMREASYPAYIAVRMRLKIANYVESDQDISARQDGHIELAADIISAYVSNNSVPVADLPALIAGVHATLTGMANGPASTEPEVEKLRPARIRKSITPNHLVSFIDGKPYKSLKRHLTEHGLDAHSYRERYGLPRDDPMVAASFSATRSELAKALGLGGGQGRQAATEEVASAPAAPRRRGRSQNA
ncbi:MucR family transcriptional regulator, partial [Methylobacterium nigriterrae]|uniref:MucR family transcriptional regulator n=1 Tax=Methylobacterium nigriterrae TaxID=3127512 RepID=UPI003D66729A